MATEVRAADVNPADWKIWEGQLDHKWTLPAPMGREATGVITGVGDGVEGFAVGDAVLGVVAAGRDGFAEHTLLTASAIAYDTTHQIELAPGQTLLLLGAGGVGSMAAQIGPVHAKLSLQRIGIPPSIWAASPWLSRARPWERLPRWSNTDWSTPTRTLSTPSMKQARRSQPWKLGAPRARLSWLAKADQPMTSPGVSRARAVPATIPRRPR